MGSLSINSATYIYIKLFRLNRVTVTLEFQFDAQPQDASRYTVLFEILYPNQYYTVRIYRS